MCRELQKPVNGMLKSDEGIQVCTVNLKHIEQSCKGKSGFSTKPKLYYNRSLTSLWHLQSRPLHARLPLVRRLFCGPHPVI